MNRRSASLPILVSTLVLIAAACGGGGAAAPAKIDVTATDFAFSPSEWSVPAGQNVDVTLTNNGTEEHEWVLLNLGEAVTPPFDADDEPKVFWEIEAEPGETQTGNFTAPSEPGTYSVVCGVEGHFEQGMVGTLTVR